MKEEKNFWEPKEEYDEAIEKLNELYMRADITDQYGDMEDMTPYEEAIEIATKALESVEKIERLVKMCSPDRTITMEELRRFIR